MLVDRQLLFTQKLVDSMKRLDLGEAKIAMEQYSEQTSRLVRGMIMFEKIEAKAKLEGRS